MFVTVLGHLFIKRDAELVNVPPNTINLINATVITPGINSFENENQAIQCVGFQTLMARGAEWAATGKVTVPIPQEFPSETKAFSTAIKLVNWKK